MKKNINVNIFGTIYAFDEDAYLLLQNYLDNMKSYFSKQTGGEEIADDIEHRIAELLWERKEAGATTVEIDAIRQILEELGNPEQMEGQEANVPDPSEGKDNEESHNNEEESGGNLSGENPSDRSHTSGHNTDASHTSGHRTNEGHYNREEKQRSGIYAEQRSSATYHRLYRDENDKVLAGVLSGLTHYFGWSEPIILRLIFVIFLFLTVGYAIMFYVILWICMKPARTAEERLEMNGKAVNPDSIKQEVLREDANGKVPGDKSSTTGCTKGCMWGCGCLVALMVIPVILFFILMLFAGLLGIGGGLLGVMGSKSPSFFQHLHLPGFNYSYTVTNTSSELSDNAWNALPDTVFLYDAVCVDGVGTVIYQQADTCGVWVEEHNGNELNPADCNIYVRDGVLHVSPAQEASEWSNVTFRLSAPALRDIEINGAGGFCAIDTLTGPSIRCDISGVGYATLLVHTDSLKVELDGIGHVSISGFANHYESSANGIGWLDDSALTVSDN